MSTKTTFKRIALVAVASLGFGLLSVVPSNAANENTAVTTGFQVAGVAATSTSIQLGAVASFTYLVSGTAASTVVAGTVTVSQTAPTDSASVIASSTNGIAGTLSTTAQLHVAASVTAGSAVSLTSSTYAQPTLTVTPAAAGAFTSLNVMSIKPDKIGIYTFTATPAATLTDAAGTAPAKTFTLYVGYSADSLRPNTAFPTQGSNTTSGWAATAGGQATVRITNFATTTARTYYVTTDNGSILAGTERDTNTNMVQLVATNGLNLSAGFNFALDGSSVASDAMDVTITDLGATSTTVTVKYFDATTGAATTFAAATVTWGVSAAATAQYSLLTLNGASLNNDTGAAADTLATTVSKTVSTTRNFGIQIVVKDQYNVPLVGTIVTATLTGPGLIGLVKGAAATPAATGRSLSVLTDASTASVSLWADGTAGTSTVSIYSGTVLLGTKVVTFVGSPTKATATQYLKVAAAGTSLGAAPTTDHLINLLTTFAKTPAFKVSVTDANGIAVAAGATVWKMVSSDSTKIVVGTCAEYATYPGNFECSVSGAVGALSGASATVTFSVYNSTTYLYDIVAAPLTFSVGGAIASTVVILDKASYSPGEAMVLTVVSKDSTGNAAYDGQLIYGAISSNKALNGALPSASLSYIIGGTYASSATAPVVFAPSVDGPFFVAGTTVPTATAAAGTAFKIDATVENGVTTTASQAAADAAAEATDAANAATDAANAAAEAADAATAAAQDAADAVAALSVSVTAMVDALRKQITSLTNLVIKIQKKVKA